MKLFTSSKFFFACLIFYVSLAQSMVQTDTHTYLIGDREVLAIDRNTGEEKSIKINSDPHSISIHKDFGYVVSTNTLTVIDLKTQSIIKDITIELETPLPMTIHDDFGYLLGNESTILIIIDLSTNTVSHTIEYYPQPTGKTPLHISNHFAYILSGSSLSVIDLHQKKSIKRMDIGKNNTSMTIYKEFGYVVDLWEDKVTVINLKTNTIKQTINVGNESDAQPESMVIHGDYGYLNILREHSIAVIDLTTNTVTTTIPVGNWPSPMVIHQNNGYIVNNLSQNMTVIDLSTNTVVQTIQVGSDPDPMIIHNNFGYVLNRHSENITVIDLSTHESFATISLKSYLAVHFTDTHIYSYQEKVRPFFPSMDTFNKMRAQKSLYDFVTMNPGIFNMGYVEERDYPVNKNEFDQLPPYTLAQELFWDVESNKPIIEPLDILATLIIMKYPQKLLQYEPIGPWLRNRLHVAFFQAVWLGQNKKAQDMLKYFIQLRDPVIAELATYKMFKMIPENVAGFNDTE